MTHFALIGIAGYIAPRHLRAISETGNLLVAALDPSDSVGVIDSYFPEADFFVEFERFDRHIDKLRRQGQGPAYISICSPNYLHDAHIRFALRSGAHAICEKPLVMNPWNLDGLCEIEAESGRSVHAILQLRLHPAISALRKQVQRELQKDPERVYDIDLSYLASRGNWYYVSWKGHQEKSGGIATNIGVHFFDMLAWIFGPLEHSEVHLKESDANAGYLELAHARVRWFLSVNAACLPEQARQKGQDTWRSITVDGHEIEFSGGFADLHTQSYQQILTGNGFGLEDARASIEIVSDIRQATVVPAIADRAHPFALGIDT